MTQQNKNHWSVRERNNELVIQQKSKQAGK